MGPRVLILCTGNSCRSQMAEAVLRSLDPALSVSSAGTKPARGGVHPMAVAVMREIGLDLSGARPKDVGESLAREFDYVITVCDRARETCPVFTGTVRRRLHIGFDDPTEAAGTDEEMMASFRKVRDEIVRSFRRFYDENIRTGRDRT